MSSREISLPARALREWVLLCGGRAVGTSASGIVHGIAPVDCASEGDLAPVLSARFAPEAAAAVLRGATLLIDESVVLREDVASLAGWVHPHAGFVLAELLEASTTSLLPPVVGEGTSIGPGVVLMPGVRIGARAVIGAGSVIGDAGFGFATGPNGAMRRLLHLGGVIIEDDVHVGPLSTIAAGTLSPTILRRGVKLDAQVHVGHNVEIGDGTMIAAQCGLAGSVKIGRGVLIGGQVGVADHVTIGDGARIAAKSGIIGDVPPGETFAGYPAVPRQRWLRGFAELYRGVRRARSGEEA